MREFWIRTTAGFGLAVPVLLTVSIFAELCAQPNRFELGVDGAISVSYVSTPSGLDSDPVQTWAFPAQRLRAGLRLSRVFQLQVETGFEVADYGEVSTVRFALGMSGLAYFLNPSSLEGPFIAFGGGLDLFVEDESDQQWVVGGGVGYTVPLGSRLGLRPACQISRAFESDGRYAETTLSGLIGFSVFLE